MAADPAGFFLFFLEDSVSGRFAICGEGMDATGVQDTAMTPIIHVLCLHWAPAITLMADRGSAPFWHRPDAAACKGLTGLNGESRAARVHQRRIAAPYIYNQLQ